METIKKHIKITVERTIPKVKKIHQTQYQIGIAGKESVTLKRY